MCSDNTRGRTKKKKNPHPHPIMEPSVLDDKKCAVNPRAILREGIEGNYEGAEKVAAATTITKDEEDRVLQEIAEYCVVLYAHERHGCSAAKP